MSSIESEPKTYDVEFAVSDGSDAEVTKRAQRAKLQIEKADQNTFLHFKTDDQTETFIFDKMVEQNYRCLLIECQNSNVRLYFDQGDQGIVVKRQIADVLGGILSEDEDEDSNSSYDDDEEDEEEAKGDQSSEDAIRFRRDDKHLPAKLENEKDFFMKALTIAEHFLNLASTKAAFSAHGVGFGLMVKKAKKIKFIFGKSPQANATNWTHLETLDKINLSVIFLERLKNLAAQKDDSSAQSAQSEIKTFLFGLAMAIVHAFGHLALEWQSKASQDDDFDTIIDSVVELGVFGKSLGLVCLNKDKKAWSSELPIVGLALDSCTHEDHLCSECRKNKDASKEKCQSSNHKKEGCNVCKKPERYQLMSESFIEMVYDRLDQVTDEYLKDRSHFENKMAPLDDQTVFKLHLENDPEVNPWRPRYFVLTNWCGTHAMTERYLKQMTSQKSQNQ